MSFINTGVNWSARSEFLNGIFPILPKKFNGNAINMPILSTSTITAVSVQNTKRKDKWAAITLPSYRVNVSSSLFNSCGLWQIVANDGTEKVSQPFNVVLEDARIAYIDTYMTGGADYNIGGTDYPHRIYFYMANLQIVPAEKVTKYDDERGTIIPLSATNYTTYTLQTINTDAFTLEKLMKISNNDHITLNYIDANGNSQSVNLIRTSEAPTIERYPKMSSGSFSCKFVKA